MISVVQYSTGAGSAEVAYRSVERYGIAGTVLLTADTLVEDDDNWRYAREVWEDLGRPEWINVADGRTPMEVGRDRRCVPNNRMAVCSQLLKIAMLRREIEARWTPTEIVLALGFDWTEDTRIEKAREQWTGYTIWNPLTEAPYLTKYQIFDVHRARGIEPPRLYAAGFSHANCGGACVRGGQSEWRRLLFWNRDRFLEWEAEEQTSRDYLGKDVAILRHRSGPDEGTPITLRRFRENLERDPTLFDAEDIGSCGCTE